MQLDFIAPALLASATAAALSFTDGMMRDH
jgi:hypothetical protein